MRVLYVDRHPARFGEFLRARRDAELVVLVPRRMPAPLRALLRQMGDVRGTVRLHLARGCRRRRDDAALAHFWEWAHAEQLWFSDDLEALGFRVCPDARDGGVAGDDEGAEGDSIDEEDIKGRAIPRAGGKENADEALRAR